MCCRMRGVIPKRWKKWRARELDPFSPLMHGLSAQTAYNARNFVLAERHARQSIAIDPNF